jgi:Na+/glutamate symporter
MVDNMESIVPNSTPLTETLQPATIAPTPTILSADIVHEYDALTALSMNVIIIICLLAAYYVKQFRLYHLPESSISLIVGIIVGGIVRLLLPDHFLQLWEFVS